MEIPREEFERLMFFEQAREQAVAEYKRNPKDVDNLTKLGRTMVELAQFVQGKESNDMIDEAVSKLEEALAINPSKHDTLWWLGNAHTTKGFQTPDSSAAEACFNNASDCFRKAIDLEPTNDAYQKSLEVSLKGPELHQEIQKQMALQHAVAAAASQPPGHEPQRATRKKQNNEFLYDIGGWIILAVSVTVWLGFVSARAAAASGQK